MLLRSPAPCVDRACDTDEPVTRTGFKDEQLEKERGGGEAQAQALGKGMGRE